MDCDTADLSQACLEQDRASQYIALLVPLLVLTTLAALLRCYTRIFVTKAFKIDDWLLVISQIIFLITGAFVFTGIHYGWGKHNAALAEGDEIEALKYQTLATLCYIINMATIKLSVAILLHGIVVGKAYIWILRISMACLTIWTLGIFFFLLFQCHPIQYQWDFTIADGYCPPGDSVVAGGYSFSVLCIITDWLYALLPIPMIWKVKMSIQAKLSVIFILSLGIFASIANLIRIKYLIEIGEYSDGLYTASDALIWTLTEPAIAIIAASMIALRPLLRHMHIRGFGSRPADDRGATEGAGAHVIHKPIGRGDTECTTSDVTSVKSRVRLGSDDAQTVSTSREMPPTDTPRDLDGEERGTHEMRIRGDGQSEDGIPPGAEAALGSDSREKRMSLR